MKMGERKDLEGIQMYNHDRRSTDLELLRKAKLEIASMNEIQAEIDSINLKLARMEDVGDDGLGTADSYLRKNKNTNKAELEASFKSAFYERQNKTVAASVLTLRILTLAVVCFAAVLAVNYLDSIESTSLAVIVTGVFGGLLCTFISCDFEAKSLLLRGFGLWIGVMLSYTFSIGQFENILYVCIVGILVALRIALPLFINKRAYVISDDQMRQLNEAARQDEEDAKALDAARNRRIAEAKRNKEAAWRRAEPILDNLYKQNREHRMNLMALDILGRDEQKIEVVDALIKIMESHRADSVPEALRVYDEQRYRQGQIVREQFERNVRQLEEKWQREEQFQRDLDAAAHRNRMEKLAQDQIDELERQRKADDYYRRYGKPL